MLYTTCDPTHTYTCMHACIHRIHNTHTYIRTSPLCTTYDHTQYMYIVIHTCKPTMHTHTYYIHDMYTYSMIHTNTCTYIHMYAYDPYTHTYIYTRAYIHTIMSHPHLCTYNTMLQFQFSHMYTSIHTYNNVPSPSAHIQYHQEVWELLCTTRMWIIWSARCSKVFGNKLLFIQ